MIPKQSTQKFSPRYSLGVLFSFLVIILLLISLGVNSYFQYQKTLDNSLDKLRNSGQTMANLLSEINVEPLLSYDYILLESNVKDALAQAHILYVAIESGDGHIAALEINTSKLNAKFPEVNEKVFTSLGFLQSKTDIAHLSAVAMHENRLLATVFIGMDKRHIENEAMDTFLVQFSISLVVVSLVGLFIFILFRSLVTSRINALAEVASAITSSDFTQHIEIRGSDELSFVGHLFNSMTDKLKISLDERDKALEETMRLNYTLEERVEHRSQELKILNTELAHQAMHDPLTNLPNRLLVSERLHAAILQARRNNERVSVFMIDLNKFKEINDTLGHQIGDMVLKSVASRLLRTLREGDTIARVGGDEFIIILPDTDIDGATSVSQKVEEQMSKPITIGDSRMVISASIGVSIFPDHGEDVDTLIRLADIAMYDSKSNERMFAVYDPLKDTHSRDRLTLMADLRDAITDSTLNLYYQPLVSLSTFKVIGVESLSRWTHKRFGAIPPDEFIPIAENSGLIKPLSKWVLRSACIQAKIWQEKGLNLSLAINLSARDLLDPDLPSLFTSLLKEYKLPSSYFKFEITEGTLMSNPDRAMEIMLSPEFSGVEYSIDDFGTGYSSLAYIKKLPVHYLKIDKSFVMDMTNDPDDRAIVESTIKLAHSLGIKVIAEGVESQDIVDLLVSMGCDYAQGYFYSKAVPADELSNTKSRIDDGQHAPKTGNVINFLDH